MKWKGCFYDMKILFLSFFLSFFQIIKIKKINEVWYSQLKNKIIIFIFNYEKNENFNDVIFQQIRKKLFIHIYIELFIFFFLMYVYKWKKGEGGETWL